jgi:60S ribosomal subunit assembly/export protein LOC1
MQTILALVNAEKEGEIESKMMRARQMEEIREARQKEAEAKEFARKQALEGKKDQLRKKRSRGKEDIPLGDIHSKEPRKKPKKVSFG